MEVAASSVEAGAAQLVSEESIVLAETKDHLNWQLIGEAAKKAKGEEAKALKAAHQEVEKEEDEHLYHTAGWARELWLDSLGLKAVLPPPEEKKARNHGDWRSSCSTSTRSDALARNKASVLV